jgi:hypothetical protein
MVSGYVASRLRIADYSFGTNYTGLNLEDNQVHFTVENASTGTTVFLQVQSTYDPSATATRTALTAEYGVTPQGKRVFDFCVNAPIIEIRCTGGGGSIRAQISSRLKWEHMAMDRRDTMAAPTLYNTKYAGPGVVAPAPFPTP